MATDETTTTTDEAPVTEEPVVRELNPPTADDAPPVSIHAVEGAAPAQVGGPPRPDSPTTQVRETVLKSDHVITDHDDPNINKYQFLGHSDPSPLPIGGSELDPRTPEQKFNPAS